jgi:hypothetical protein
MTINREALLNRCKGYCEFCGGALPDSWAAHHRKLRSQGGKDDLDNVVALHHECHNLGTNSVHLNPKKSYENGFMVHSWETPENTPLHLAHEMWVLLTQQGEYKGSTGPESTNEKSNFTKDVGD